MKEISSPQFYSVSDEEVTVYLEHEGQIVQVEYLNESVYTNVSISKSGYTQVVPGQEIRYTFKDIGNNSTVPLDSFIGVIRCPQTPSGWIRSSLAPTRPG